MSVKEYDLPIARLNGWYMFKNNIQLKVKHRPLAIYKWVCEQQKSKDWQYITLNFSKATDTWHIKIKEEKSCI